MDFHVGIGTSQSREASTAGREAAQKALAEAGINQADFLLVLADANYNHQDLLRGVREISQSPMIGGSTAGELSTDGVKENSVVITAISSSSVKFNVGYGENLNSKALKAGEQIARMVVGQAAQTGTMKSFLLLADGLSGQGMNLLQGVKNSLGNEFEIVGAMLADRTNFKKTVQYFNGQIKENSMVGVLISGDVVTAVGLTSGWESVGNRMQNTKSSGNVIYELDGQPALEIYKLYLGSERSNRLPEIAFEYPLGIYVSPESGKDKPDYFYLRTPLGFSQTDGRIIFGSEVPEKDYLTITAASRLNVLHQVQEAAQQAKTGLLGAKPLWVFVAMSLGYKLVLGPRIDEALKTIKQVLGDDVPMIGLFTYGELGPIDKNNPDLRPARYHNQACLVWVLGTNEF